MIMEEIARYRERELRQSAARYSRLRDLRRRQDRSIQHRVGWALVRIGLALACGADNA
jgi:uncharacterized protein YdaU (DUF1376 family)